MYNLVQAEPEQFETTTPPRCIVHATSAYIQPGQSGSDSDGVSSSSKSFIS